MMLLKAFHHAKHHFPSLFRVDLEVSGMAIGGKNILPMAFSSPLFMKEVSSGCFESLMVRFGWEFHKSSIGSVSVAN